jgi:Ala-tRNA(Pro) deacylase
MAGIYDFLESHQIAYTRIDHPPVYTVEDVHRLVPPLPAAKTKNLFFRDKKGQRHFLVIVEGDKRVDLKRLPETLSAGHVSFGSAERLKKFLGIEPGSVSLLALANDPDHHVEVIIDCELWKENAFQFHPLVNTSTLVIEKKQLERFLAATGHPAKILEVPGQKGF